MGQLSHGLNLFYAGNSSSVKVSSDMCSRFSSAGRHQRIGEEGATVLGGEGPCTTKAQSKRKLNWKFKYGNSAGRHQRIGEEGATVLGGKGPCTINAQSKRKLNWKFKYGKSVGRHQRTGGEGPCAINAQMT